MQPSPPNWRLPAGVTPGLWDYLHDEGLARECDDRLKETPLLGVDRRFVERHIRGHGRVIDLGCGTGELTAELHHYLRADETTGLDSSDQMLAKAEAYSENNLKFIKLYLPSNAVCAFGWGMILIILI